jgi:formylglycine-generating enzyme required for sulfatase activity
VRFILLSDSYTIDRFVQSTEIESDPVLLRVVRQLRYTEQTGRYSFDIEKTIHKTIHDGGMARPVFTPSRRHIEYLMLIDRHNSRDHRAHLHNNLYETLKANNIFVERFWFDNSPLLCRNHRHPGGIALSEILGIHEHAALLLFTDGLQCIDTEYVGMFAWTGIFKHWQHRYFFSSVPPVLWGERERLLQEVFPFVLPLSVEGMQVMAADLSQMASADCDWLRYWPDKADYARVPIQTGGRKLDYIGLFFTTGIKRWIAACAVYPELDWNLTLALGKMFSTEKNVLPSYNNISQLLRLGWFIKGSIPDVFRLALLKEWLSHEERVRVYQFLYDQLSQNLPLESEPDYSRRTLQLAVYDLLAQTNKELFEKKAKQLASIHEPNSRLPDMVSIHLINEHEYSPVFFEIPDAVLKRMGLDPAGKVPLNFVRIPEGEFTMGSPEAEPERFNDETEHRVKVSEFYLCKYAVTVKEYLLFADETKSHYPEWMEVGSQYNVKTGSDDHYRKLGKALTGEDYPVVGVSWDDADAYCKWMSEKTGKQFRLPTEAEWEYACRAGTTTPFNTGYNLTTEQANYDGNYPYNNNAKGRYREATVPVGSSERFLPNQWGLYHMHGNVYEWCSDWYGDKYYDECSEKGVVENPDNQEKRSYRVLRGGSWPYDARNCRSAHRYGDAPGSRSDDAGFRLAFVP